MALSFLPPGPLVGPTLRAFRLGYRWCDDFGQFLRISDAGEGRWRIDLAPYNYVLREYVKDGQYHRCWWESPGEHLRDLVEGLRLAVERNRRDRAVTFFADDHMRELTPSVVERPTRKRRVSPEEPAVEVVVPKTVISYPQSSQGVPPPWQLHLLWPQDKAPPTVGDGPLDIRAWTREETTLWLCARSLAALLQEIPFLGLLSERQKSQFLLNLIALAAWFGLSRQDLPKLLKANGLNPKSLSSPHHHGTPLRDYRWERKLHFSDPMMHLVGAPEPPHQPEYDRLIDDLRYGSRPLRQSAASLANRDLVASLVRDAVAKGEEWCREFLFLCCEFLLHSPLGVVTHLMIVDALADHLKMSWTDVWESYLGRPSRFHDQQVRLIDRQEGSASYQSFCETAMFRGTEALYEGEEASRLIGLTGSRHFDTPAETPLFGIMTLFCVSRLWNAFQRPSSLHFVEMGPGTGALAETMARALGVLSAQVGQSASHDWHGLQRALRYQGIERSHTLAAAQRERWSRLTSPVPLSVLGVSASDPSLTTCLSPMEYAIFFSHELLDMFPPVKVLKKGNQVYEVRLTHRHGVIQEILVPLAPHLGRMLEDRSLENGQTDCLQPDLEPWSRNVAKLAPKSFVMTWLTGGGQRGFIFRKT